MPDDNNQCFRNFFFHNYVGKLTIWPLTIVLFWI
jgi:hypothetical protein